MLVVGAPRSGTTWFAEVVAEGAGLVPILEPDNEKTSLLAFWGKRHVSRFPLAPDDASAYARMWRRIGRNGPTARALAGGNRALRFAFRSVVPTERMVARKEQRAPRVTAAVPSDVAGSACRCASPGRLIKSVHGVFAVDEIARWIGATHVVLMLRTPYAVLASWRRMRMPDADRPAALSDSVQRAAFGAVVPRPSDPLQRSALQLATMQAYLQRRAGQHPDWKVVAHEDLLDDPEARFRDVFTSLDLEWTERAARAVRTRNTSGEGFRANRVASEEKGKWRRAFTDAEKAAVDDILRQTGNASWIHA